MAQQIKIPQPDGTVLVMTKVSEFSWSSRFADGTDVVDRIVAAFNAGEIKKN